MKGSNLKHFFLGAALVASGLWAAAVTIPNTFSAGEVISSAKMNANFATLKAATDTLEGKATTLENKVAALENPTLADSVVWTSPLGFISLDGSLSLNHSAGGESLEIKSASPGDQKRISLPLQSYSHKKIKKVTVCYKLSSAASFITQLQLNELTQPPVATAKHDDGTNLTITGGQCYESGPVSLQPTGALNLVLRFDFANTTDIISIGAIGLTVGP